jgi:hypothetical protein
VNYLCVVISGHSKVCVVSGLTLCTAGEPTAILVTADRIRWAQ